MIITNNQVLTELDPYHINSIDRRFNGLIDLFENPESIFNTIEVDTFPTNRDYLDIYENLKPDNVGYFVGRVDSCLKNLLSAIDMVKEGIPGLIAGVKHIFMENVENVDTVDYHGPLQVSIDNQVEPELKRIISRGMDARNIYDRHFIIQTLLGDKVTVTNDDKYKIPLCALASDIRNYMLNYDATQCYTATFNARSNIRASLIDLKDTVNSVLGYKHTSRADGLSTWVSDACRMLDILIRNVIEIICCGYMDVFDACYTITSYKY